MLEKSSSDLEPKGELYADTPMTSTVDLFEEGSVDPVYQAKARVLNAAIQDMGMGKYQVRPSCLWCCNGLAEAEGSGCSGGCLR